MKYVFLIKLLSLWLILIKFLCPPNVPPIQERNGKNWIETKNIVNNHEPSVYPFPWVSEMRCYFLPIQLSTLNTVINISVYLFLPGAFRVIPPKSTSIISFYNNLECRTQINWLHFPKAQHFVISLTISRYGTTICTQMQVHLAIQEIKDSL